MSFPYFYLQCFWLLKHFDFCFLASSLLEQNWQKLERSCFCTYMMVVRLWRFELVLCNKGKRREKSEVRDEVWGEVMVRDEEDVRKEGRKGGSEKGGADGYGERKCAPWKTGCWVFKSFVLHMESSAQTASYGKHQSSGFCPASGLPRRVCGWNSAAVSGLRGLSSSKIQTTQAPASQPAAS